MASICAPRQIPKNGRCSLSGTAIQSISCRTKSSESFALIGPPNITAPAWPSSVPGSGSPNRGRLISSLCPNARNTLPTRPGLEVSWCRTISTGSKALADEGATCEDKTCEDRTCGDKPCEDRTCGDKIWAADTPPGKRSTVSGLILLD